MVDEKVGREKALDFSGSEFRHCPPVCAGLLLGGTSDTVLTVCDSDLPKNDYFG